MPSDRFTPGDPTEKALRIRFLKDIISFGGLYSDSYPVWSAAHKADVETVGGLQALPTYEEFLKGDPNLAPNADLIIEISVSKKIRYYNLLVKRFNRELPKIKETKNYRRANEIAKEALGLRYLT